ncbi:MAG TPA: VOC family protein [Longimicrobiales bacterium]|nr:VOC family protein [Longimicrobiales bacterium]
MSDGALGVQRIGQIAITVRDIERARAFYGDVLELRHLFDAPPKMSFFECGGVRLLLGEAEAGGEERSGSILYLDVPDIRAAHRLLVGRGVSFDAAPHKVADLGDRELWLAFFRDSEHNVVALMSEIAVQ